MLEKISIIAITKNTVSSCVQWDRRLYARHSLVAKLPITIKNSRSAERVYNLQKIHQLRSVTEALVSNTPSNRQLMRSRRIETAVLPDLQGYEPPNKRRTINSLKPYSIANKSNDGLNVELNEQSRKTVHRLAREHLHLPFQNLQTGRTENDEIYARNVRTSLYDRTIAFHKKSYICLWLSRTKINMTPVIRSSITCNS